MDPCFFASQRSNNRIKSKLLSLVNAGMHPFINNRDDKDLLFGSDKDFFDFEGFVHKYKGFKSMDWFYREQGILMCNIHALEWALI